METTHKVELHSTVSLTIIQPRPQLHMHVKHLVTVDHYLKLLYFIKVKEVKIFLNCTVYMYNCRKN